MENKKILWIIRYSDGTLASFFGTKEEAIEVAEKRKSITGDDYVIS